MPNRVMPVTYTNRRQQTYHLNALPTKTGGVKYSFAMTPAGQPVNAVPEGFEIYETPNGQVLLRRKQPERIRKEELATVETAVGQLKTRCLHWVEVRGRHLWIHQAEPMSHRMSEFFPHLSETSLREISARHASFQPMMRFGLADEDQRLFLPERYCFRGSVQDWIPIGRPEPLAKLIRKYLPHLGNESFFDLY